jgi:hypothetical protein
MCFRYLLTISTWPRIVIKVTFFQCILLRDITVARIFWLSQSEERKNSAKPKKLPSMIRNVSLVNGQTDRLALPYCKRAHTEKFCEKKNVSSVVSALWNLIQRAPSRSIFRCCNTCQNAPILLSRLTDWLTDWLETLSLSLSVTGGQISLLSHISCLERWHPLPPDMSADAAAACTRVTHPDGKMVAHDMRGREREDKTATESDNGQKSPILVMEWNGMLLLTWKRSIE